MKSGKIVWPFFLLAYFCFFENSNREIDQVVKTHLTPFLINSVNHLLGSNLLSANSFKRIS